MSADDVRVLKLERGPIVGHTCADRQVVEDLDRLAAGIAGSVDDLIARTGG